MTIPSFSDTVRNAVADAVETAIGASPKLRFYSGVEPADETAALGSAVLIAEGDLPADWMAGAATGVKAKAGAWTVTGLPAAGTGTNADFFRLYDATGAISHVQGPITATGGGGVIELASVSIANAQVVAFSAADLTTGN